MSSKLEKSQVCVFCGKDFFSIFNLVCEDCEAISENQYCLECGQDGPLKQYGFCNICYKLFMFKPRYLS